MYRSDRSILRFGFGVARYGKESSFRILRIVIEYFYIFFLTESLFKLYNEQL